MVVVEFEISSGLKFGIHEEASSMEIGKPSPGRIQMNVKLILKYRI